MTDTSKQVGIIKWFNSSKGFGFVTNCSSSEDVFVHHTGITVKDECWKTLYPGEYVQYSLNTDDDGKTTAVSVTGIEGGPLLCETRHRLNQQKSEYKRSRQSEEPSDV